MIREAVTLIRDELRQYIVANRADDIITREDIVLDNIAALEAPRADVLKNKVVISVVNVEEESTLKNGLLYMRDPATNSVVSGNAPVHVNLYLLFSATLADDLQDAYRFALHRLALVIEFFQAKRLFTIKNSPGSVLNDADNPQLEELRLLLEMYTLTFEQINHLWGSLGGKQVPFVMYKMRMVKIWSRLTDEKPLVEQIHGDVLSAV